ncbi:unnamed protein product, partial [Prorocentrum cordatum]
QDLVLRGVRRPGAGLGPAGARRRERARGAERAVLRGVRAAQRPGLAVGAAGGRAGGRLRGGLRPPRPHLRKPHHNARGELGATGGARRRGGPAGLLPGRGAAQVRLQRRQGHDRAGAEGGGVGAGHHRRGGARVRRAGPAGGRLRDRVLAQLRR